MDMRIPPLTIKIVLESNPLKSIMLVWRLAVINQPIAKEDVPSVYLACLDSWLGWEGGVQLAGSVQTTREVTKLQQAALCIGHGHACVARLGVSHGVIATVGLCEPVG